MDSIDPAFLNPRGWRLTIGKIAPTVYDFGGEYRAMMPKGVEITAVNQGTRDYTRDEMSGTRDRRFEAAKLLDEWGVDTIIAGGAPIATLEGAEAEEAFIDRVQSELEASFTTSIQAAHHAIQALDADSIGLITPFPADRTGETAAYFESSGIDVPVTGGPSVPNTADVRGMSPNACYRAARDLVSDSTDSFDAIYIPCVPFGAVELIEMMEADLGLPVVMSAQAHMWKLLTMEGIVPDSREFGELFRTI